MIQGTDEWLEARRGKITGSRFRDVMAKGRGKAMSETRSSYMRDLAYERMTGLRVESPGNRYTDWGHEHEPTARIAGLFRFKRRAALLGKRDCRRN